MYKTFKINITTILVLLENKLSKCRYQSQITLKSNKNNSSFDIALIMNLFKNELRAGWASVLGLLTWPVAVNRPDSPGLGQSRLEKYQPAPKI